MKWFEKFKINIYFHLQKLKLTKVTLDDEIVAESKIFKNFFCFLNFNEDSIQFEYKVDCFHWKNLSEITKEVFYNKTNPRTYFKSEFNLPIFRDDSEPDNSATIVKVDSGFKDALLNLFSPFEKEFSFVINYTNDFSKHKETFFARIPSFPQE